MYTYRGDADKAYMKFALKSSTVWSILGQLGISNSVVVVAATGLYEKLRQSGKAQLMHCPHRSGEVKTEFRLLLQNNRGKYSSVNLNRRSEDRNGDANPFIHESQPRAPS